MLAVLGLLGVLSARPLPVTAALPQSVASAIQCNGGNRWPVKTGTDADVSKVDLSSTTATTIKALKALTPGTTTFPQDNRIPPVELTVYSLSATLVKYQLESDQDYHLVLQDSAGRSLITEAPDPPCVGSTSPFLPYIRTVRSAVDSELTVTTTATTTSMPVTVRGVGFWDGTTGGSWHIELHPLLAINFTSGSSTGTISGKVTDAQTNGAVAGATVSCGCAASTTTASDGTYSLPGIATGSQTITASASGYSSGNNTVSVTASTITTDNLALNETSGVISGSVVDASTSAAISAASVACSCGLNATTDASGNYTIAHIPPGTYDLTASATGYTSGAASGVGVLAATVSPESFTLIGVHQVVFSDGFESGNLSAWSSSSGMTVESTIVHRGSHAAQANANLAAGYAKEVLPSTYSDGYGRLWFDIQSQSTQANVLRFKTSGNTGVAFLAVLSTGQLALNVNGTRVATSATAVSLGVWHELEMRTTINNGSLTSQVWLDGNQVNDLSVTVSLGTSGITSVGMFQIGEAGTGETYNIVFDDAAFDTQYIS
jgi:hypothetical protein